MSSPPWPTSSSDAISTKSNMYSYLFYSYVGIELENYFSLPHPGPPLPPIHTSLPFILPPSLQTYML